MGVGSAYSDKSGTVAAMGSPWAGPVVIYKPTYNITIAGTERKATEACGEYLALLERMVAPFKADRRMRRIILLRVATMWTEDEAIHQRCDCRTSLLQHLCFGPAK